MFILQETNSIKGKGLEGEFVYSWDGKDIVLLPVGSNDYKACTNFTDLQSKKVSAKDLKIGATYQTKREEKLVYLGKYDYYIQKYQRSKDRNIGSFYQTNVTKSYIFYSLTYKSIVPLSSLVTIAQCINDNCIDNYAELMQIWNDDKCSSSIVEIIETPAKIKLKPLEDYERCTIESNPEYSGQYGHNLDGSFFIKNKENDYTKVYFNPQAEWSGYYNSSNRKCVFTGYTISYYENYILSNNILKKQYAYRSGNKIILSLKDIENMNLLELSLKMSNGKNIKIENL